MVDNSNCFDVQKNERLIYLSGMVKDDTVSQICERIANINMFDIANCQKFIKYEIQPIHLYIQSFGGSVNDMWALIDTIESSVTPIITYCSGYCMSAAALIFLAGHYRIMYKHSDFMLHQIFSIIGGKINDIVLEVDHTKYEHKRIMKYIKKHTKLPKKLLKTIDLDKEDLYLTAKDCIKYGICDEVIKKSGNRKDFLSAMKEQE